MRPVEQKQPKEARNRFLRFWHWISPSSLPQPCKGGGGLLCAEGRPQTLTLYWMVITPDGCDGCSPCLALCLHCLPFLWKGITQPLGSTPELQGANLETGPGIGKELVPFPRWTRVVITHRIGTTGCGSLKVRSGLKKATSTRQWETSWLSEYVLLVSDPISVHCLLHLFELKPVL